MREKEKNSGITLIALVVTIIILLILAGVSLAVLTGQNGLIVQARRAKDETEIGQIKERMSLAVSAAMTNGMGTVTYDNLDKEMKKEFGDNYEISPKMESEQWMVTSWTSSEKPISEIVTKKGIKSGTILGMVEDRKNGITLKYEVVEKDDYSVVRLYPKIKSSKTYGDYAADSIYGKSDEELEEILAEGASYWDIKNDWIDEPYENFDAMLNYWNEQGWTTAKNFEEFGPSLDCENTRGFMIVEGLINPEELEKEYYDFDEETAVEYSMKCNGVIIGDADVERDTRCPYVEYEAYTSGEYKFELEYEGITVTCIININLDDMDDIDDISEEEWENILANTREPHPEQENKEEIGIGTDGNVVNLDWWNYRFDGDYWSIVRRDIYGYEPSYIGPIESGKIKGTIPQYISKDGVFYPVKAMESAFAELYDLKRLPKIPPTIEKFGIGACGITRIVIPSTVTSLEDGAFNHCSELRSINIPDSVTKIGVIAFCGCTKLKNINIPNGVTIIWDGTFDGCSGLTSIEIPNSVTSIGSYAFRGCSRLTSIEIPNGVTQITIGTFAGCTRLTKIYIPASVSVIDTELMSEKVKPFEGCSNLKIYCEASSSQAGWTSEWNYYSDTGSVDVEYNYSLEDFRNLSE